VRKVHRPGPASGVLAVSITAVIGHGPLRRLLLLDPPPPGCAAAAQPRLDLAYCFSCADGWEPAFHLHDTDGRPRPLDQTMRKLPLNSFEGEDVRPAIAAKVMRTPPRWQHKDWAMANDRENLNRIGGEPTWIQDPGYPACPSCRSRGHHLHPVVPAVRHQRPRLSVHLTAKPPAPTATTIAPLSARICRIGGAAGPEAGSSGVIRPAARALPGAASTPSARLRAASSARRLERSQAARARCIRLRSAPVSLVLRYSPGGRYRVMSCTRSYRQLSRTGCPQPARRHVKFDVPRPVMPRSSRVVGARDFSSGHRSRQLSASCRVPGHDGA
jgi:hypothetical protein